MSDYTERELVNAAARGDASAYAILVERHARRIHAVAYARLLNAEDARDAMQDALVLAYERLLGLIHPERLGVWISVMARRRANRVMARRQRDIPSCDDARPTEQPDGPAASDRAGMRRCCATSLRRKLSHMGRWRVMSCTDARTGAPAAVSRCGRPQQAFDPTPVGRP